MRLRFFYWGERSRRSCAAPEQRPLQRATPKVREGRLSKDEVKVGHAEPVFRVCHPRPEKDLAF